MNKELADGLNKDTLEKRKLNVYNKKFMSYKENEVVAKFTKGNAVSDCGEYNLNDLLDMFDETNVTKNESGDYYDFTVNDCIENNVLTKSLVCTTECDDMFCYLNEDNNEDVMGSFDENGDAVDYNDTEVECSASLDNEFANESI